MTKHFMVDIETLSTAVNAAVLSVGAVEFDPFTGNIARDFYRELRLDLQQGRHISASTVQWWAKQISENPSSNILAKSNAGKTIPMDVVCELGQFINGGVAFSVGRVEDYKDIAVWACDPDFDLAILSNFYGELRLPVPWKFWETRSVRTARMLNTIAGIEVPQRVVTHNALEDCERQVEEVSALLSVLHRLDTNKAQLFSARNSVMASRYSNNEMCFTANVDNLLLQVDKTFNLTNEAK